MRGTLSAGVSPANSVFFAYPWRACKNLVEACPSPTTSRAMW